jgi:hypothetical protein
LPEDVLVRRPDGSYEPLGAGRALRPAAAGTEAELAVPQRVTVPALTVWQPWAWAIAAGLKPVENRGWFTSYRGPLAIHAGRAFDNAGLPAFFELLAPTGVAAPRFDELPRGAVVALTELVEVCDRARDPAAAGCGCGIWAATGQYHWRLTTARPLTNPVPGRGRQGLFEVDLPAAAVRERCGTGDEMSRRLGSGIGEAR